MGFPNDSVGREFAYNAGDMRESSSSPRQVQALGQEDLLKGEMATHSIILAWEIPWTEEAGGLQSTGSQSQTRLSTAHNIFMSYRNQDIHIFTGIIIISTIFWISFTCS